MNYLAIDTSTDICSVSLFNNSKYNTLVKDGTKDHSEYLPVFAKKLLDDNSVNIKFIALNIGPGSFTGLKIGSSFSKGLAKALNIPIIPVSSFDALNRGINLDYYYLAIYSHRDFAFYTYYKKGVKNKSKCDKISNFNEHKVFGYGFPNDLNIEYHEVKPCSEKVGLIGNEQYKLYKNKSINEINPIYLMKMSK
jgi:tRNA threonylcarbamoyl adenosine modification protein YeaZ